MPAPILVLGLGMGAIDSEKLQDRRNRKCRWHRSLPSATSNAAKTFKRMARPSIRDELLCARRTIQKTLLIRSPDLKAWRAMLNCESFDRVEWERNWNRTWAKFIWFDASSALREPVRPRFQLVNFEYVIAGYGLIMCAKLQTGELINCDMHPAKLDYRIRWEPWEKRLDPADFFEELTRVPAWEKFSNTS